MADAAIVRGTSAPRAGRRWSIAVFGLTLGPIAIVPLLAPTGSAPASAGLGLALFVGTSMHVASTLWFYTVREVRTHVATRPGRFFLAPVLLVVVGAVLAILLPNWAMVSVLFAFFAWQCWHYQKQNVGIAALAARAHGVLGPSRGERVALLVAGAGAIAGLLGRPQLLQVHTTVRVDLVFGASAAIYLGAVTTGVALLVRRPPAQRRAAYCSAYLTSLAFFAPVWLFASPYAAVAGLTVAHGLQYLLLVGLVAGGAPQRRRAVAGVIVLADIAIVLGVVLSHFSHLHDAPGAGRALYGVFLGLSAAHFVIDAGLWRLRDEFPRAFLTERLPYLLAQR